VRAITYSEYGPPEVLKVREVDQPEPRDNEVLIRVHAAEATKADCEMRSFSFAVKWFWLPLRLAVGIFRPRRHVLGGYFSGEVVSIGSSVTRLSAGDRIFGSAGLRMGAYGEYLALPENACVAAKPGNMSYAEAAAVPLGGLNAIHFMRHARIQPGESVLINGAGGSIGAHAVQIAKSMGAEVTGVDSGIKQDFMRRLGADHCIDYAIEKFTDGSERYDVIFDMVPGSSYSACIQALNPGGRYLCGNPRLSVMLRSILTTRFSNKMASFAFAKETREELLALKAMIEAGQIQAIVDRVYSMEDAAEAHHRVETEDRIGAIVIDIGGSETPA
tara:strand:+ start:144 stop:1136 length:993 start_codon:yes stop_codon:yes gene_type:complete